jgi:hypothetical protein
MSRAGGPGEEHKWLGKDVDLLISALRSVTAVDGELVVNAFAVSLANR